MNKFSAQLLLVGLLVALFIVQSLNLDFLEYRRATFVAEPWQALSHLLIHLNYQHLVLNASALVAIYFLFDSAFESPFWFLALLVSAVFSSCGLYFFSENVEWCQGMSGALHGLFVYAAIRARAHWLWIIGLTLKIFFEQTPALQNGLDLQITSYLIKGDIVVDAHMWGALGGLAIVLLRSIPTLGTYAEIGRYNDQGK